MLIVAPVDPLAQRPTVPCTKTNTFSIDQGPLAESGALEFARRSPHSALESLHFVANLLVGPKRAKLAPFPPTFLPKVGENGLIFGENSENIHLSLLHVHTTHDAPIN